MSVYNENIIYLYERQRSFSVLNVTQNRNYRIQFKSYFAILLENIQNFSSNWWRCHYKCL